jgi:hypothetical protein
MKINGAKLLFIHYYKYTECTYEVLQIMTLLSSVK